MTQLPEKFLERLKDLIPQDIYQQVLHAFSSERAVSFRVNTIKVSTDVFINTLQKEGFSVEQIPWYKDAFLLRTKSKKDLLTTDLYKQGWLYIQNLSSMIPPLVLNPQDTDIILDMAAAPGSKTTQLASLMHNQGILIANDKSRQRLFKLKANLKEQYVTNTETFSLPGEFLWRKYPEYFDKVLLDAPCSMEGRINLHDPKSYLDWTPGKIKHLSSLQKWLLRSAVSCTRVNGTIVYSTCALSPEENEEVIDWILKKTDNSVIVEKIHIPHLSSYPGLLSWKKKQFSRTIENCLRIYPSHIMEGFFVAKLRKIKNTL